MALPRSPFTTRLSGSAGEARARIRGIAQGRKRRAPLWLLGLAVLLPACCGALVSCQAQPAAQDAPESTTAPVTVSMDSETYPGYWDEAAWTRLSEEQRALLSHPPVDELPREPVELFDVWYGSAWQDTLIPLARSQDGEVVLYGVVICEKVLPEEESVAVRVEDCGILLRWGDKAAYYPLSWYTNLHYAINPWLEVSDFDQDGQLEAAVCFTWGHGTGVWAESLYLFEQDTLEYTVPNCGALADIACAYDSSAHTATLSARDYSLTVSLSEYMEPLESISLGGQVRFSYEEGLLMCEMDYDFSGALAGFLVTGRAPVLWQDGTYQLGSVTLFPILP